MPIFFQLTFTKHSCFMSRLSPFLSFLFLCSPPFFSLSQPSSLFLCSSFPFSAFFLSCDSKACISTLPQTCSTKGHSDLLPRCLFQSILRYASHLYVSPKSTLLNPPVQQNLQLFTCEMPIYLSNPASRTALSQLLLSLQPFQESETHRIYLRPMGPVVPMASSLFLFLCVLLLLF